MVPVPVVLAAARSPLRTMSLIAKPKSRPMFSKAPGTRRELFLTDCCLELWLHHGGAVSVEGEASRYAGGPETGASWRGINRLAHVPPDEASSPSVRPALP
jgi:hypothetical protein